MQTSASAPPEKGMPPSRQWLIIGIAAVAVLALFLGLPPLLRLFAPKPPPEPAAPPPGTFVATPEQWATLKFAKVAAADFSPEAETDGKIATDDDVTTQVFSPYSGRVTKIFVKAGDKVRAGQPLFAVAAAEFVQGQSDLTTAVAQAKLAQANEARLKGLLATNGIAVKDYQQSQSDLAAAEASLHAARDRLKVLGKSDAQIAAMEASPAAGAAAAETVVSAPISGTVTQRSIGVGQTLGSVTNGGTSPAFVISDLAKVWLVGNLREADSGRARVGQPLHVHVQALPDRVFTATVNYVSPTVDPATRRVAVRATVDNPDGVLKPEMFADFDLITGTGQTSASVSEDSVIYEGDTARVWVADPARRLLSLREIKVGEVTGNKVQVLSGVEPGESVVTSGSLFIDRAAKPD
jgi:cobalt-zinc-cadmium efflux system membrane fusion protein